MSLAITRILLLSAIILMTGAAKAVEQPATGSDPAWRLLFSNAEDVTDTWGKLSFGVTSLHKIHEYANPGFNIIYAEPADDGAWTVFGFSIPADSFEKPRSWKLVRASTRDARTFDNIETVFESPTDLWANNVAFAYNPDAKEYMLLNLRVVDFGFQYTAHFSADGRHWQAGENNPMFYDGDAISLFWSPVLHRFICVSKSLQPWPKHLPDHGGKTPSLHDDARRDRRVLVFRSSPDGRHWDPDVSMNDVWNRLNQKASIPEAFLTMPDADDPPDLEFYSGNGFWYYDRAYLMVLNYAASPLLPNKHGPHLDTEWWLSRDGLHWQRPYRDGVNALGDIFPDMSRIENNPMVIDGQILFQCGNWIIGMPRDRFSYVTARANAEFTTQPFVMPETGLLLNAAVPSPPRPFATRPGASYIMAALLDEQGQVIPGYEKEKCPIENTDRIDIPLSWGQPVTALAGQTVKLRFFLRSANIYAVTAAP